MREVAASVRQKKGGRGGVLSEQPVTLLELHIVLLLKCLIFESFSSDVLLKKENKLSLCLRCAQDVQIEREKQVYNVTGGCTALTVVYLQGKLYVGNAGDSRCRNRQRKPDCQFVLFHKVLNFFFPCVCRAIIIRNSDIIPMSTEFTPESERQRLQFLVKNEYEKGLTSESLLTKDASFKDLID